MPFERGFHLETMGMQHVAADNQCCCPELAVAVWEKFNSYMPGTCQRMCKEWDKEMMSMDDRKKHDQGATKLSTRKTKCYLENGATTSRQFLLNNQ